MKNFELNDQDFGMIMNGLRELPYKMSAPIIEKLIKQYNEQEEAKKLVEQVKAGGTTDDSDE
jgi:hypothetical protein